jgi:poly(A) polymerase
MGPHDSADKVLRANAERIVGTLRAAGHEAYFAGGCVRDLVMGAAPHDYDVTTSARPEQVMALFERTVAVGAAFGVVLVILGGREYEVATFRTEGAYSDGRHPDAVAYATAEEDVKRRDFTINGLLYDPSKERVIDHVGGRADIERRVVRTIGEPDARFAEDRLRLIRAVRFAARLGFEIERETMSALRRLAPAVTSVSWERIRDELVKMFTGPNRGTALRLLHETGLLAAVLPEVEAMAGVEQPTQFHPEGDVFEHTALVLDALEAPNALRALGALLHDIGKPPTFTEVDRIRFNNHDVVGAELAEAVCKRLRLSNEARQQVVDIVRNHMRFMHAPEMRESTLKRLLRRETFADELAVHKADCVASHGDMTVYDYLVRKMAELPPEVIKPAPLITGHDLIAAGYAPGPLFGEILDAVEDLQLEGALTTHDEAMAWVREHYPLDERRG